MGLKDLIARYVAGPKIYGDGLGRHAREEGSALATTLLWSHGTMPQGGQTTIFDTFADMEAAGFTPRFKERAADLTSLTVDEQLLFKNLQTAMISFASTVNTNGAMNYMRQENASKFRNGFELSLLQSMVDCGLVGSIEAAKAAVLSLRRNIDFTLTSMVLNTEKPASGDILELSIVGAVHLSQAKLRYGFVREGMINVVPFAEDTLKSISAATLHYKW